MIVVVKEIEAIRSDFCYTTTLLHIIFFSGQCGFNMALLVLISDDQPVDYISFIVWLVVEGFLITMVSPLLLYGVYKQVYEYLMFWLVIELLCLLLCIIGTIAGIIYTPAENVSHFMPLNTSFNVQCVDLIGLLRRIYLVITIGFICWLYKDMEKGTLCGNIYESSVAD